MNTIGRTSVRLPGTKHQIIDFARDFAGTVGARLYLSVAVTMALGLLDGIGLLFLVPVLTAAGLSANPLPVPTVLSRVLHTYLPLDGRFEVVVLIYFGIILAYAALKFAGILLNASLIERYSAHTRIQIHGSLTRMSWRELLRQRGFEIAHSLTTNIDVITRGALAMLQFSASSVVFLAQFAVAMFLSPPLALGAVVLLVAAALAGRRLHGQVFGSAKAIVASGARLQQGAEDFVRRQRHVRTFGNTARTHDEFADEVTGHAKSMRNIQGAIGKTQFLAEACSILLIAATFFVGVRVLDVPLGTLIAFTVALARLLPRVMSLQRESQVVASSLPAFETIRNLLTPTEAAAGTPSSTETPAMRVVSIRWDDLAFRLGALRWRIPSLELRKGELVALVGQSGLGKSALCDVLAGLLESDIGQCFINGQAVGEIRKVPTLIRIGYLSQHSRPWQRTVAEALRWAAPAASDRDLWAALEQADLASRLRAQAGLETPLGDSSLWLSGGELHRLALAQVLVRDPQILVLDEPSAALDAATELNLVATIKALSSELPVLIVTHRESVSSAAHRVVTMLEAPDGARVVTGIFTESNA